VKFKIAVAVIGIAAFASALALTQGKPESASPILAVGHGAFIGADGKRVIPTRDFILRAQEHYLDVLHKMALANKEKVPSGAVDETRSLVYRLVPDKTLANALMVDWLIEKLNPTDAAHITATNNALRLFYVTSVQANPVRNDGSLWSKGLRIEIAKQLEENGVKVLSFTTASSDEYIAECRKAGVPVPDTVFGPGWKDQGPIGTNNILGNGHLWSFKSDAPDGVCLGLPRHEEGANTGRPFGVICMGIQTRKACFFDNVNGENIRLNVPKKLSEFASGARLATNGQGVCTDCHAGENPFVVHPEDRAFSKVLSIIRPSGWTEPIVAASWPQNPGPTNLLDAVSSPGQCNSCHQAGSAGRFPDVSTQLPKYCSVVLPFAIKNTMPPSYASPKEKNQYTAHVNALLAACSAPPTGGGVDVPVPAGVKDNPGFVSAPIVVDPLYQCTPTVTVRSTILDAKVHLYIDGTLVGTQGSRNPSQVVFNVPSLIAGQKVVATQEIGGAISSPSAMVVVRDHRVDYPSGLPAPTIDPNLVYQCAETVAVRHVNGAGIAIYSNGANPSKYYGANSGWTTVYPGKRPFDVGDKFSATAEFCGDVSPMSAAVSARAAPTTLPAPRLQPLNLVVGQQLINFESLVNGSFTTVNRTSSPATGSFTTPVSWYPNYDIASILGGPIRGGESVVASQKLCTAGPKMETPPVRECESVGAPRIRTPIAGTNYVVVDMAIPGARIRVYDDTNNEIGDGSGTIIMLSRGLVAGERLLVTQEVGECKSRTGYRISVHNPK
jgi:hypothetical protein